jgi:hypothetical protein
VTLFRAIALQNQFPLHLYLWKGELPKSSWSLEEDWDILPETWTSQEFFHLDSQ